MRVTERGKFQAASRNLGRLNTEQQKRMVQLSSGKRLHRLSDDPIAAQKITQLKKSAEKVDQYQRNIDFAKHPLEVADAALDESSQLLYRVKELTIQGLSSALTNRDREHIANEVNELTEQLRTLANTEANNQHLFGGFSTDIAPYDNTYTFVGDTNIREVQVSDDLKVKSLAGGLVFGDGTAATVDVFDNLIELEVAIRAGVEADMQTEFGRLDDSIEQVISGRNELGIQLERIEGAQRVTDYYQERFAVMLSEQRDVDFTQAVSELQLLENALQVSMAASGKMMQRSSLVDFI